MLLAAAAILVVLLVLSALLYLSAVAERQFLSPRAVVLSTVRARRSTPEYAEQMVAKQFEELLRHVR